MFFSCEISVRILEMRSNSFDITGITHVKRSKTEATPGETEATPGSKAWRRGG